MRWRLGSRSDNVVDRRGIGAGGISAGVALVVVVVSWLFGVDPRQMLGLELQADCFAGVWGHHAQKRHQWLDAGDIEAALNTASAIGDDRLQRKSKGEVVPDSFTHGTSVQRVRWFRKGFESGNPDNCDTFTASRL